jgi:flagellar biosynthetic protein FliR
MSVSIPELQGWALMVGLTSLRVGFAMAYAPPFTMLRAPAIVKVILALALGVLLVRAAPASGASARLGLAPLVICSAQQVMIGLAQGLFFQFAFSGLQIAARMVDVQAGFGFASVIDPSTNAQTPVTYTLLSLLAGAWFFSSGGFAGFVEAIAGSFRAFPIDMAGAADASLPTLGLTAARIGAFGTLCLALGYACVASLSLMLFILDLGVAAASRAAPRMNALVLGFQVKALLFLIAAPLAVGTSGVFFLRLLTFTERSIAFAK